MHSTDRSRQLERLRSIFEDQYKYKCNVHSIKNLRKPQLDLNMAVRKHIDDHDGPNNLLIFYYTGHGGQTKNGLELSAQVHLSRG
jgi:hypothetical protein